MIIQHWKNAGVIRQGVDHVNKGSPCQDRIFHQYVDGVSVIALADGAGSRAHSEIGADIVVHSICNLICNNFDTMYMLCENVGKTYEQHKKDIKKLKEQIIDNIINEISMRTGSKEIRDYASTMLFFAYAHDKYIVGHIGDGVIGILEKDNNYSLNVLSKPENGGAPNITYFVTDDDAKEHIRINAGSMSNISGIIIMSDGPEEVLYTNTSGLNPNAVKILTNFKGINSDEYNIILEKFLEMNIAKYSYDDLSISMMYLENIDTEECDDEYIDNILNSVVSKKQIKKISSYAVTIRDKWTTDTDDFSNTDDVKSYMEKMIR